MESSSTDDNVVWSVVRREVCIAGMVATAVFEWEIREAELGVSMGDEGRDVCTPMSRWNSSVGSLVTELQSSSRYSDCRDL